MTIDKKINYVNQDGYKNYIKNSDSVTVPKEFKSREDMEYWISGKISLEIDKNIELFFSGDKEKI